MKYPKKVDKYIDCDKWDELREKLAEIEHQRWADWQAYLHSKLHIRITSNSCDYIMQESDYKHWERQIITPYSELTEKEKDSDREQVDRYFPLLKDFVYQLLTKRECADENF